MSEAEVVSIDSAIQEIFAETDLQAFQSKLIFDKQLTRLEHFFYVADSELKNYGLSEPAIRRLRAAIDRKRRKRAKFFGNGKKSVRLVQVKRAPVPVERQGFEFNNARPFLIPKNEIKLLETLGEGNFSVVKRALWTRSADDTKTECAVKILHEMSEPVRQDLAVEISNMQRLRHQNLVQLFGIVFADSTLMVLEYCEGGSLLNRLRDQSKPRVLVSTLLNYSQQIATGMSYLESRRCVHRDLAARNVLLSHEEQIIKICDFGLTRALSENERLYIMQVPKKVPFSWCPPESLRFRQFSHKSDVWAFGVTMWELYTYGEEPWIGSRAAEVLQFIESGQRLRKPEYCPHELYEIMKMCWCNEATERPKFSILRKMLMDFKFMHIICRNQNISEGQLCMLPGDEILLINEQGMNNDGTETWYGQSMQSRKFGEFPRASVAMKMISSSGAATKPLLKQQNQQSPISIISNGIGANNRNGAFQFQQKTPISFPVAGSFIHTGHGDIDERQCWGHVDKIDDIYLKNPIVGPNTMEQTIGNQKVTCIPSLMTVHKDKAPPRPPPPQSIINGLSTATTNVGTSSPIVFNGDWPTLSQFSIANFPNTNVSLPSGRPYSQSAIQTSTRMAPNRLSSNIPFSISTPPSPISNWDSGPSSINSNGSQRRVALSKDAMDWISNELAQLNGPSTSSSAADGLGRKNSTPAILNQLDPPPQQRNGGTVPQSSSKYDSSISILRPNRTSPNRLTPPIILAESFALNSTKSPSVLPPSKMAPASSLPSTSHSLGSNEGKIDKEENFSNDIIGQTIGLQQRPSSTHSFLDEMPLVTALIANKAGGGEDPFWVKDDVKTLTSKLPYKEVHKANGFLANNQQNGGYSQPSAGQQERSVAVVAPFMMPTPKNASNGVDNKSSTAAPMPEQNHSQYDSINGSLLPPPSKLLLSGFDSATTKNGSHFQYQPIFDISGTSSNHMDFNYSPSPGIVGGGRPRLRYGSNGIPILEPVPMHSVVMAAAETKLVDHAQTVPSDKTQKTMITLGELDTDVLLKRVKNCVDFASWEQCRQYLLRNGFDVERAIRELKIEKLLELGLATDRELAASALDSVKWDINAAANRLCCS